MEFLEFKDRVPTYPGRVKLTPVNGGEPILYDSERVDEPIEVGSPINRALVDYLAGLGNKVTPQMLAYILTPQLLTPEQKKEIEQHPEFAQIVEQSRVMQISPRLVITAEPGANITVTNGDVTFTAVAENGRADIVVPRFGEWEATAQLGGQERTRIVTVDASREFHVSLQFADVFGVEWDWTNPSTRLRRLTSSNDPNGYVNTNITTDPVPAVGNGTGSSPFDEFMPWMDMDEFNIINNKMAFRRGESGFTRIAEDVVVRIPKFYYHIEQDHANTTMRFYVSDKPFKTFRVHEAFDRGDGVVRDNIYVGKYNTGAGYVSRAGLAPLVNIARNTARTNSANKGAPWWQYDYTTWCAIWLLYIIEFADWNSQERIGLGRTDSAAPVLNAGGSDAILYHTGRAAGINDRVAVMYRHIENLWGNVMEWCDGISTFDRRVLICLNPEHFVDGSHANYEDTGIILPTGVSHFITSIGYSKAMPFAFLPTEGGGSATTFIPDVVSSNVGWRNMTLSSGWGAGSTDGLFGMNGFYAPDLTGGSIGARLMFLP